MIYATLDSEDGHIDQNAYIAKFKTREKAEEWLRAAYDPAEWNVEIDVGFFGDCWIRTHDKPRIGDPDLSPFSYTQLSIRAPGQHPGGPWYWIEPRTDVLIARPRALG